MRLQLESVIAQSRGLHGVISGNQRRGRHDRSSRVGDGQNIGRFGPFATLIGNRFATFLGDDMTAVQIEFR